MTSDLSPILRAESAYREGRFAEARALLTPLTTGPAADATALRLEGMCLLRLGEAEAGLVQLRRALALAPDDPWAVLHCGIGMQAVGRHAEAAILFARATPMLPDDAAPCVNHATALLALGTAEAAVAAGMEAIRRAPQAPAAHYTLGQAQLAAGALAEAEASFATTTRLLPNFTDAWINLGLARYRQHNAFGAIEATRMACRLSPAHRGALGNLVALMRLNGQSEQAEALLYERLAKDPEAGELRVNLAALLLQEERAAEALAALARPLPEAPALRQHWLLQQSLALLQLGRADEARAVLANLHEVQPAFAPLLLWRQTMLALVEGNAEAAMAKATEMEQALTAVDGAMLPEHAIMARYDLAKFWSQRNRPERAFPMWAEGHRLLSRSQPFDRAAYKDFIDASISLLDRARLHDGPRASNTDKAPVFIVGMPRSGTTLIESILDAHGMGFGAGERGALSQAMGQLAGGWEDAESVARLAAQGTAAFDRVAGPYLQELHALAPEAAIVVDKMPGNFRHCGLISLLLPGARIIHCARDPRDIGLSIFTFRFHGVHSYAHNLADLGWYIAQQERLMAHWKAVCPNPILTVHLSDWVTDFPATLARVLDFLGLPDDPACARFHEVERRVRTVSRTQVREGINAKGLGRWRGYAAQLGPLIAELEAAGVLNAP